MGYFMMTAGQPLNRDSISRRKSIREMGAIVGRSLPIDDEIRLYSSRDADTDC